MLIYKSSNDAWKGQRLMKIVLEQQEFQETEITLRGNIAGGEIQGILALLSDYRKANHKSAQRLLLQKDDEQFYINIKDILYFSATDDLVQAYTKDAVYLTKDKLYQLKERLSDEGFIQISRQELLNSIYVRSVQPELSGNYLVTLKGSNYKPIISRRFFKEFKTRMMEETL